jgi:hypothetical protein
MLGHLTPQDQEANDPGMTMGTEIVELTGAGNYHAGTVIGGPVGR